jgi:hypothetical protein
MDPNEFLNGLRKDGKLDTGFRSTPGQIAYHVAGPRVVGVERHADAQRLLRVHATGPGHHGQEGADSDG